MLPQGLSVYPELFDISTAEEIRNTENVWKNADDVLGGGSKLEELDDVYAANVASNSHIASCK